MKHLEDEFAARGRCGAGTGAIASASTAFADQPRMIFAENIYGVDINPASVEITAPVAVVAHGRTEPASSG